MHSAMRTHSSYNLISSWVKKYLPWEKIFKLRAKRSGEVSQNKFKEKRKKEKKTCVNSLEPIFMVLKELKGRKIGGYGWNSNKR